MTARGTSDNFNLGLEIFFNLQIFVVRDSVHERRGRALSW